VRRFNYPSQGFKKEKLVEESEKEWKEWLKTSQYKPIANIENHDTIGMIALDANGDLSEPALLGWRTKCMDELVILYYRRRFVC
jgi:hypothetical protein